MATKAKTIFVAVIALLFVGSNAVFSQTPQGTEVTSGARDAGKPKANKAVATASKGKFEKSETPKCSCKSGDGKKSCSVSCSGGQSAYCDCDETSASCTCN